MICFQCCILTEVPQALSDAGRAAAKSGLCLRPSGLGRNVGRETALIETTSPNLAWRLPPALGFVLSCAGTERRWPQVRIVVRLFSCQACGNIVHFENRSCGRCGHRLAFLPERVTLSALKPMGNQWQPLERPEQRRWLCTNIKMDACNWLVDDGSNDAYCAACCHNGTVPDLSDPARLSGWRELEVAKHRLFYSLLRWKLPLKTRAEDPEHGLIFNFLADDPATGNKVMTGHDNGVITVALTEADDIERERRRLQMNEPYRTLLGHFRHEVGHYFWDILVHDGGRLEACRAIFGDDRIDYAEALARHHSTGASPDWQRHYVSAYATMHPWEDFAETWAHYLHIVDTLEMAAEFGLKVHPKRDKEGGLSAQIDFDPYIVQSFDPISRAWLPFVFAMNSVNRAMGTRDLYPFALSPRVLIKLEFIHQLIHDRARAARNREPFQHEKAVLKQSIPPEKGLRSSEVAANG
jgi:hypothetical protein